MTLAEELIAWVERYAKKVCPDGCLPTPGQEREINLFARITRALQGAPKCEVQTTELWAAIRQRDANINAAFAGLNAIEEQLHEMRSLKGWRLNLIRENLEKAKAALRTPTVAQEPSACPFCGNATPRTGFVCGDPAVICGSMDCGAVMFGENTNAAVKRWSAGRAAQAWPDITHDMEREGQLEFDKDGSTAKRVYRAMLAAAPLSATAAQPLQSRDETLRGLAEFFSESVHHVWDNHEIADCLTNMIGQGSELPSAQQDTLEETAQRLVNELTSQHIPRDKFFIGIGDAELHAYVQLPKVDCRADRIGGWPVVWHFNVGPAEAYALPSTPRETPHE